MTFARLGQRLGSTTNRRTTNTQRKERKNDSDKQQQQRGEVWTRHTSCEPLQVERRGGRIKGLAITGRLIFSTAHIDNNSGRLIRRGHCPPDLERVFYLQREARLVPDATGAHIKESAGKCAMKWAFLRIIRFSC